MSQTRRASAFHESAECAPQILESVFLHQRETITSLEGITASLGRIQTSLSKQHSELQKTRIGDSQEAGTKNIESLSKREAGEDILASMAKHIVQDRENIAMQLQLENKQLHECIAEYEGTMTVLVQKHKDQMNQAQVDGQKEKQSISTAVEKAQKNTANIQSAVHQLNEQLLKSHSIIKLASESHEAELSEREITISRLQAENEGLRQLLQISDLGGSDTDLSTQEN